MANMTDEQLNNENKQKSKIGMIAGILGAITTVGVTLLTGKVVNRENNQIDNGDSDIATTTEGVEIKNTEVEFQELQEIQKIITELNKVKDNLVFNTENKPCLKNDSVMSVPNYIDSMIKCLENYEKQLEAYKDVDIETRKYLIDALKGNYGAIIFNDFVSEKALYSAEVTTGGVNNGAGGKEIAQTMNGLNRDQAETIVQVDTYDGFLKLANKIINGEESIACFSVYEAGYDATVILFDPSGNYIGEVNKEQNAGIKSYTIKIYVVNEEKVIEIPKKETEKKETEKKETEKEEIKKEEIKKEEKPKIEEIIDGYNTTVQGENSVTSNGVQKDKIEEMKNLLTEIQSIKNACLSCNDLGTLKTYYDEAFGIVNKAGDNCDAGYDGEEYGEIANEYAKIYEIYINAEKTASDENVYKIIENIIDGYGTTIQASPEEKSEGQEQGPKVPEEESGCGGF